MSIDTCPQSWLLVNYVSPHVVEMKTAEKFQLVRMLPFVYLHTVVMIVPKKN